jgi:hypothetical protein
MSELFNEHGRQQTGIVTNSFASVPLTLRLAPETVEDDSIKIFGLSDNFTSTCPTVIENSSFFYISRLRQIMPWYDIFVYYFFIISSKLYIHEFEFKNVYDDFFIKKNNIVNVEHIKLIKNMVLEANVGRYNVAQHSRSLPEEINIIHLDKVIFIKFVHNNAGHAFNNILNTIYFIMHNQLDNWTIVITEDLIEFSYFVTSVIYYFFKKEQIVIINDTTLVHFNTSYIIPDQSYKKIESINYLISHLKRSVVDSRRSSYGLHGLPNDSTFEGNDLERAVTEGEGERLNSVGESRRSYNNICLIKSSLTKCQNVTNKLFSQEYVDHIQSRGFKMIIPENLDIVSLFRVIYNAKNVIMSWGCCSYLNSIFVNEKSNILILCHNGYSDEITQVINEYTCGILNSGWFPVACNKKIILYDLDTEINNNTKKRLNDEIDRLLSIPVL